MPVRIEPINWMGGLELHLQTSQILDWNVGDMGALKRVLDAIRVLLGLPLVPAEKPTKPETKSHAKTRPAISPRDAEAIPKAVDESLAVTTQDNFRREARGLVDDLGEDGSAAAFEYLKGKASSADDTERQAAILLLIGLGRDDIQALRKVWRRERSFETRLLMVRGIRHSKPEIAIPLLSDMARFDDEPKVRDAAVEALIARSDRTFAPVITEVFLACLADSSVRWRALDGLIAINPSTAAAQARARLDLEPRQRLHALQAGGVEQDFSLIVSLGVSRNYSSLQGQLLPLALRLGRAATLRAASAAEDGELKEHLERFVEDTQLW